MHRPIFAFFADLARGTTRALSQYRTNTVAFCSGRNSGDEPLRLTEAQAEFLSFEQQALFAALHRPGQRAAGADRVHAVKVTELGRLKHDLRIVNAAKWP